MKDRPHLLFVCTANYYRSRFAELYCNHVSRALGLPVMADSAGLEMARWRDYNPGELSPHASGALEALGIDVPQPARAPKQFSPAMLTPSVRLIAMSEVEHRPMMERLFPEVVSVAEFWAVEDVEYETPAVALKIIRESVERCLEAYR